MHSFALQSVRTFVCQIRARRGPLIQQPRPTVACAGSDTHIVETRKIVVDRARPDHGLRGRRLVVPCRHAENEVRPQPHWAISARAECRTEVNRSQLLVAWAKGRRRNKESLTANASSRLRKRWTTRFEAHHRPNTSLLELLQLGPSQARSLELAAPRPRLQRDCRRRLCRPLLRPHAQPCRRSDSGAREP